MTLEQFLAREGWSIPKMAVALQITDEAVRLYVKGRRTPRPEIMEAIHRVTGGAVQPNDFFDLTRGVPASQAEAAA